MEALVKYFKLQEEIFNYFGYKEDWVVIPLSNDTRYYWRIIGGEGYGGTVRYGETVEILNSDEDYYEDDIYTQRFLPKWVYRGKDYTMICVDTCVDGNKFLQIFDNSKEVKV